MHDGKPTVLHSHWLFSTAQSQSSTFELRRRAGALLLAAGAALFGSAWPGMAAAKQITAQFGDADKFGINAKPGAYINADALLTLPGDSDGTDQWRNTSLSWVFTYELPDKGSLKNAELQVVHAGDGSVGIADGVFPQARLFMDGNLVGLLPAAYDWDAVSNLVRRDYFDLTPFADLLTGSNAFRIAVIDGFDGWALDYARLEIKTVPVPATAWLFLCALSAIRVARAIHGGGHPSSALPGAGGATSSRRRSHSNSERRFEPET